MLSLYVDHKSPIHELHAGIKLVCLVMAGTGVFVTQSLSLLLVGLGLTCILYAIARIPWAMAWLQIRALVPLLVIIFIFQALLDHWTVGVLMVIRFLILILLASLLTLTTRVSAMIETIETTMRPFERFGVNPTKVSLAISLSIRFLPLIAQKFEEVREAQKTRGLGGSIVATAVPLIIRTLRMADDTADALEARSYDSSRKSARAGDKNDGISDHSDMKNIRKVQK